MNEGDKSKYLSNRYTETNRHNVSSQKLFFCLLLKGILGNVD